MNNERRHRIFKDSLYGQFARIGKALASPRRLEILELLSQGGRTVESMAEEIGISVANASQHLRILHGAGLVETTRHGLFIEYRPADDQIAELCRSIRVTAERRLTDLEKLLRTEFADRADAPEPVSMQELLARAKRDEVVILDTRPAREYAAGHIAGALSIPIDELHAALGKLPKSRKYVAYCRGPYCVYADRAVELLRESGRRATRLADGFPEWRLSGFPVERGPMGPIAPKKRNARHSNSGKRS